MSSTSAKGTSLGKKHMRRKKPTKNKHEKIKKMVKNIFLIFGKIIVQNVDPYCSFYLLFSFFGFAPKLSCQCLLKILTLHM